MKAIRRFSVHPVLPEPLRPLSELAHNLRWSWHPPTRRFFRDLAPEAWRRTGGDPLRTLCALPPSKLAQLASDSAFLRRLAVAAGDLHDALNEPGWYQREAAASAGLPRAVAYFSPEFGITGALPQYSGGLGILAGDHLKAAGDLGVPLIGVGLLYRHGYFRQSLSRDGSQQEDYPELDPAELPLRLLREADGMPVRIALRLPGGRSLYAHVWQARVGRVPLLLLDSAVQANAEQERRVTDRLYGGGGEHRLLQEMLLGIGGVRAVRAYCRRTGHAEPEVFHTNEGHAGFLGLERIRELGERGLEFEAALESVRAGNVFTTHTPVPAGIDRFETSLIASHFGDDGELEGVATEDVLRLGAESYPGGDPGLFNMAVMGLRLAQRANGVSSLHGEVSRTMFAGLWPGFDPAEVPITSVTNGVHAPTWRSPRMPADAPALPDAELWALRRTLREQLVHDVRARLRASWRERGAADAELGWTDGVFDPDVLTIGFARRVPSYKRLTLMLRDPERLTRLLLHPERPVQIVVAGKAHPADEGGKRLIGELVRFADDPRVRHRIVFLPDYGMDMAQDLYPGCDVWLNNPLRPLEACGTSGMKAALNGCLNLSVRDGWWDEWFDADFGWAVPTADGDAAADEDRRDGVEAAALYSLIEDHVAPCFYDGGGVRGGGRAPEGSRAPEGGRVPEVPVRWVGMVRRTLARLGPKVQAERMVREYVERLYGPAARSHRELSDEAAARGLGAWKARVRAAWPSVSVALGSVEHDADDGNGEDDRQGGHERHGEQNRGGEHEQPGGGAGSGLRLGASLTLRAKVALGGLSPEDVEVQAVAGPVDGSDRIAGGDALKVPLKPVTSAGGGADLDGRWTYEGTVTPGSAGPYGYTVRVLPAHPLLASGAELGLAAVPSDAADETPGGAGV
ncbi:glycosyltransferase family 1 protein [Streptomyces sp. HNM0575]|uniref:alpha-glucan family phosphorylase n=1 Tax=Streptomyces sp. HNM0575 TaxID=2716338 RepID=UPI00145C927E|nr:glycosyltransferase family 1 protein [Streptomyces sp. HNM0575]